ncbi:MAG: translation initiation factor IF-2 [Undibacterium sp.]|nr:translation initiation factor IF-2 [Opitutaceae bacterium]
MSTRIHELAKQYNQEPKELLAWLKERGFVSADTKSVSSTVSKIYFDELEKEFGTKAVPVAPAAPVVAPVVVASNEPSKVNIPAGVFVKSTQDLAREREAVAVAKAAALKPAIAAPVPAPTALAAPAPKAPAPLPPRPVSAPPVVAMPAPMSKAPSALPTLPPRVTSAPAPISIPPLRALPTAPAPAVGPAPVPAPIVVSPAPAAVIASAPIAPPAISKAPSALPSMPIRPGSSPIKAPPLPGAMPATASAAAASSASVTVTQVGDVKLISMKPPVIVRDFATALGMRPFQLISELMQMGIFAAITQSLDETVAAKLAEKHGFMLEVKHRGDPAAVQAQKEKEKKEKKLVVEDDTKDLETRPPVVCILGHVDHGKTSLLDAIRKADVAAGEAGGITQHIGAYQIDFNGRKITFLDTPGHAAFTKMRSRGASATDVAILVVAADDGFMPQTDEALKIALNEKQIHADKFALLVAVNKMDVKGANLDQVKGQMQQRNIAPEDWGGETVTVPVSAIKGTGINELLEMILLQADVLELKANPKAEASGVIIESQVDVGRGPLATVIVQRGTLRVGDAIVCGPNWAKVRAMFDDQGKPLKEAPPSTPARVIGWTGTPDSGATFKVVKNSREAEKLAEEEQYRLKKITTTADATPKEMSVDTLFANIAATQQKVLKLVIKTDVFGSTEAVRNILEGIKSSKVSLEIVSTEVGIITKNDVLMAGAAGSVIIGFNTKLENGVTPLAKHHGVRIETYAIIYELGDKVREMMADLLDPDLKETKTGVAEVRATFPLAKGFVAGCLVTEGKINRNASARVRRGKEILHEGKIGTLKRFKDDANEIRAGLECGIKLDDFNGYQKGDLIECFEVQKVRAAL